MADPQRTRLHPRTKAVSGLTGLNGSPPRRCGRVGTPWAADAVRVGLRTLLNGALKVSAAWGAGRRLA